MADHSPIYLDHHATTPCDPRVVDAMAPTYREIFGNAASRQHAFGRRAEELVESARLQVARLIGADPREVVFTSGATESDNLAIKGLARSAATRGRHIVTCVTEHRAVLDCCERLERSGFRVSYLPVEADGRVRPDLVAEALRDDTALVSLMYGNNEIGTLHPVAEIGALLKERGILFHCDAVQAVPYLPCRVDDLGVDLLSISAHKMYGPKGVGALYVRRKRPRVRLDALLDGGAHERGLRSGTLNVHGIVGLGTACEIAAEEGLSDAERLRKLRDRLLEEIRSALPDTLVNGSLSHRLPNNLNLTFPGVSSEDVVRSLEGVAVSSGAACSSATFDGSYVLKSLGRDEPRELGGVRFGLGRSNTLEEIARAAREVVDTVRRLRARSSRSDDGTCASACVSRTATEREPRPRETHGTGDRS